MKKDFNNDQEAFWAGEFGDAYIERNQAKKLIASNTRLFSEILTHTAPINSVLEFGANIGLNLTSLSLLLPEADISGVEINDKAFKKLSQLEGIKAYHSAIQDFEVEETADLVFTKTVLIHINPEALSDTYDKLYYASNRYVLLAEYYNPKPVEITYRGHDGKLFKRDFAGELMDRHRNLKLVDYGFAYHRDKFSQDDITWFLMEKQSH
jgi:pseudaminic acid biosynthesis-associated methylase